MADDRPITLAAVAGAHGVGGEVRLRLFGESLDDFARYRSFGAGGRQLVLRSARMGSNGPIARFEGIDDRNAAEALRGTELTVPRSALPPLGPGEYYHADLVGLPAETPDGEVLGSVVAVENFGAGDILEIERTDGERFMVPIGAVRIGEIVAIDPDFIP